MDIQSFVTLHIYFFLDLNQISKELLMFCEVQHDGFDSMSEV